MVPLRGRVDAETVGYDVQSVAVPDRFVRPSKIGRYQVLEVIGMGGMGVVCTAYDPKLDRKVAIKLLRDHSTRDSRRRSVGQARLVREAQALAKLSHPNVITVHDVDTWEGSLYMAMEFVQGRSLADWMEAAPRHWRDVVAHFVAAGRGLAAAHAAGIIHRDFKPHNVLLGDDGRVRVVDFGLAKSAEEVRSIDPAQGARPRIEGDEALMDLIGSTTDAKLTQLGRSVGTPAYMAPEQHLGESMSPATDQFSFAISLYEALYGDLPFRGDDPFWEATTGKVRPPPDGTEVPTWVHQVVLRALEPNPIDRFASMDALLAALQNDPARRRRRWALGAGVVGVGGVGMLLGVWAMKSETACQGAADRLGNAWGPERKALVQHALVATGLPYADDTWDRVAAPLDAYAADWIAQYQAICEATHVHGEQSEALLDIRMSCLDRRRNELTALVDVLTEADAKVVEQAVAASHGLRPSSTCVRASGGAIDTMPEDPDLRQRIGVAQAELDRAEALLSAGRFQGAATIAAGVVETAELLRHPPTRSRAFLLSGKALMELGKGDEAATHLREAVLTAAEADDPRSEAEAWSALVYVVGSILARYDEALAWETAALAALQRVTDRLAPEADLGLSVGTVLLSAGRLSDALVRQQRALELARDAYGAHHPKLQGIVGNLGITHARLGRHDEAEALLHEALSLSRDVLGPAHPAVAKNAQNLGNVMFVRGELSEAARLYEQALSIHREALGSDHPLAIDLMIQLGRVHRDRGEYEDAQTMMGEALRMSEEAGHDTRVEQALTNLGLVLMSAGRPHEAEARFRTALEYSRRLHGEEHVRTAKSSGHVCRALLDQQRPAEADAHCELAERLLMRAHDGAHMDTALAKIARARALLGTGQGQEATALAHAALDLARTAPHEAVQLALAELEVAAVLRDAKGDGGEIDALVTRARDVARTKSSLELTSRLSAWTP